MTGRKGGSTPRVPNLLTSFWGRPVPAITGRKGEGGITPRDAELIDFVFGQTSASNNWVKGITPRDAELIDSVFGQTGAGNNEVKEALHRDVPN